MENDKRWSCKEEVKIIFVSPNHEWEDFMVMEINNDWTTFYEIAFEYYVGHESIEDAIEYFRMFLREWRAFLVENKMVEEAEDYREKNPFVPLYRSYGIDISYEYESYYIGVNPVELYHIGEIEEYLSGIIEELEYAKDLMDSFDGEHEYSTEFIH